MRGREMNDPQPLTAAQIQEIRDTCNPSGRGPSPTEWRLLATIEARDQRIAELEQERDWVSETLKVVGELDVLPRIARLERIEAAAREAVDEYFGDEDRACVLDGMLALRDALKKDGVK